MSIDTSASVNALTKVMSVVALFMRFKQVPIDLRGPTLTWSIQSQPVLKTLNINGTEFLKLITAIRQSNPDTNKLPIAASAFATALTESVRSTNVLSQSDKTLLLVALSAVLGRTNAMQELGLRIGSLRDSRLVDVFTPRSVEDIRGASIRDKEGVLVDLVTQLIGKPGFEVPQNYNIEDKSEIFHKYLTVRAELHKQYTDTLSSLFTQLDRSLIPATEVLKLLSLRGVHVHGIPSGFTGNIDKLGNLYIGGTRIEGVPTSPVRMNPKYVPETDDTYVFQTVPDQTPFYTVNMTKKVAKKGERQISVYSSIADIKRKWRSDLRADRDASTLSTILELVYVLGLNLRPTDSDTINGRDVLTLQVGDIEWVTGGRMRMSFPGDTGQLQVFVCPSNSLFISQAVANVRAFVSGKAETDLVFTIKGSIITPKDVSHYLSRIHDGLTVREFLLIRGTETFINLVSVPVRFPTGMNPKEIDSWLSDSVFAKVASQFSAFATQGSNVAMSDVDAVKKVDPATVADFYDRIGVRRPKWLESNP